MPRTKRVVKKKSSVVDVKPKKNLATQDMVNTYLKSVEIRAQMSKVNIDTMANRLRQKIELAHTELILQFQKYNDKTTKELKNIDRNMNYETMATGSTTKNRRRSRSVPTETKERQSRANIKIATNQLHASRSLSRAKLDKDRKNFNTPLNIPSNSYGLITPKVKPNTPHVLLRHPQQGEIAVSMQGSPLLINRALSHRKANVNIPLLDGRVISILPEKGLRTSEIPDMDPQLKQQIKTLRDNLNQVLRGDL
ncbi:hypothetical protein RN001_007308 [Aquatica leii]|uniref:Borealin C-terminal domain-containing protein n=1 Tax=Aquatica leii TaxID=1421715 RepID=A0AAN7P855_9COLE|nr:hypothetical protein RN001_007308 [Aquatica leii]